MRRKKNKEEEKEARGKRAAAKIKKKKKRKRLSEAAKDSSAVDLIDGAMWPRQLMKMGIYVLIHLAPYWLHRPPCRHTRRSDSHLRYTLIFFCLLPACSACLRALLSNSFSRQTDTWSRLLAALLRDPCSTSTLPRCCICISPCGPNLAIPLPSLLLCSGHRPCHLLSS